MGSGSPIWTEASSTLALLLIMFDEDEEIEREYIPVDPESGELTLDEYLRLPYGARLEIARGFGCLPDD